MLAVCIGFGCGCDLFHVDTEGRSCSSGLNMHGTKIDAGAVRSRKSLKLNRRKLLEVNRWRVFRNA